MRRSNTITGTGGVKKEYQILFGECNEEELLEYLRKLFAFLTLQKILALVILKNMVTPNPISLSDLSFSYLTVFGLAVLTILVVIIGILSKPIWAK